jgi:hypothetical protein
MTIQQSHMDMIALQAIVRLSGSGYQDFKGVPLDLAWRMYGKIIEQRYELAVLWAANLIVPQAQLLGYDLSATTEELSQELLEMSNDMLPHAADENAIRAGRLSANLQGDELADHLLALGTHLTNPFTYINARERQCGEWLQALSNHLLLFKEFNRVYRGESASGVMLNRMLNQPTQRGNMLFWFEHLQQVLKLVEPLPSFKQMSLDTLKRALTKANLPALERDMHERIVITEACVGHYAIEPAHMLTA